MVHGPLLFFTGALFTVGWLRVLCMGKNMSVIVKICSQSPGLLLCLSVCLCRVGMQEYDFLYKPGALDGPLPFVGKCALRVFVACHVTEVIEVSECFWYIC